MSLVSKLLSFKISILVENFSSCNLNAANLVLMIVQNNSVLCPNTIHPTLSTDNVKIPRGLKKASSK